MTMRSRCSSRVLHALCYMVCQMACGTSSVLHALCVTWHMRKHSFKRHVVNGDINERVMVNRHIHAMRLR